VVRSTQLREESSRMNAPASDDSVSVGNELPAANAEDESGTERESATTTEEVVNYEISKTTRKRVVEGGRLDRLSVAVLVDGLYEKTEDGALQYAPRPEEQLEKIATLVRSAVGFDEARGDQVEVVNMRFADTNLPQPARPEPGMFDFSKSDYFRMAELAVVALIAVLVLLFVIRPLVRRIITPEIEHSNENLAIEWSGTGQLPPPEETEQQAEDEPALLSSPNSAASEALKNAKIIGEVQANAIRDVGEIVENNNEAAVSIVRSWIQERET
jgi:flagellar M-ring protein FliF